MRISSVKAIFRAQERGRLSLEKLKATQKMWRTFILLRSASARRNAKNDYELEMIAFLEMCARQPDGRISSEKFRYFLGMVDLPCRVCRKPKAEYRVRLHGYCREHYHAACVRRDATAVWRTERSAAINAERMESEKRQLKRDRFKKNWKIGKGGHRP